MSPTKADIRAARRRLMKYAAATGVLLGLVCNSLPPRYQVICNTVSSIASSCGGGN